MQCGISWQSYMAVIPFPGNRQEYIPQYSESGCCPVFPVGRMEYVRTGVLSDNSGKLRSGIVVPDEKKGYPADSFPVPSTGEKNIPATFSVKGTAGVLSAGFCKPESVSGNFCRVGKSCCCIAVPSVFLLRFCTVLVWLLAVFYCCPELYAVPEAGTVSGSDSVYVSMETSPGSSAGAGSGSTGFRLAIEPSFSMMFGGAGEYVFVEPASPDGPGTEVLYSPDGYNQLSRLDWTYKPLLALSLQILLDYKNISVRAGGETSLPVCCGIMEDSDWLGTGGEFTHYSRHTNYLDVYAAGSLYAGWRFSFAQNWSVTPRLGITGSILSFTGKDGYRQYADPADGSIAWSPDIEKIPFSGEVISYRQETFAAGIQVDMRWQCVPQFALSLLAEVQPFVLINGYDTHHVTNTDYIDYRMTGLPGFSGSVTGELSASSRILFIIQVAGGYQPVIDGSSWYKPGALTEYSRSENSRGGASRWFFAVSCGFRWQILGQI